MTVTGSRPAGDAVRTRPDAAAPGGTRAGAGSPVPRRGADRLPAPPRERRPVLVALGLLLVAGGALSAGLLALRLDERSPVLVAARDIAAGQQITEDDLAEAPVAADGVELIRATAADQVVGTYAAAGIPAGRLLDTSMLARDGFLGDGLAAVGLAVPPGRLPAEGLEPGDRVSVVSVPEGGPPREVSEDAVVSTVGGPPAEGSLTAPATGDGNELVTLVVPASDATDVAAAAIAGSFSLVLLERGS